ncbi:MBL fold metallo-hydrolase [Tabrizicola sp.]|uniref:MBL fold metallo-hydrolase n=1 Tax=Tabrizicola sp. TaxID=2005166 RepID=UPI00286C58D1|nr:MBL fold metallo-hydrolase [Tabrizicola sp.]
MRVVRMGPLSAEVELGDLTVIALSDGETAMPLTHLRAPDGAALTEAELARADVVGGKLRLPVRAFLVKGPAGCLMIDTGAADAWHPVLGRLGEAMLEAGVAVQDVTAVALTHTHVDHLSGLVDADGGLRFPNAARVFVATEELADFRADARMAPVLARLMPLEQGDGPMRGVVAINAPGHSPGHMAFLVDGRLLIWGDIVHHAAVQFARPEVTWVFDTYQPQARATREALMARAVEQGLVVAGAHLPDPGIGRISALAQGYAFHPLELG